MTIEVLDYVLTVYFGGLGERGREEGERRGGE